MTKQWKTFILNEQSFDPYIAEGALSKLSHVQNVYCFTTSTAYNQYLEQTAANLRK